MERTVALRNLLLVETALRLPREPKTAEKSNPVKKHDVSEKRRVVLSKKRVFSDNPSFSYGFLRINTVFCRKNTGFTKTV